jgi:hypothetical protein
MLESYIHEFRHSEIISFEYKSQKRKINLQIIRTQYEPPISNIVTSQIYVNKIREESLLRRNSNRITVKCVMNIFKSYHNVIFPCLRKRLKENLSRTETSHDGINKEQSYEYRH